MEKKTISHYLFRQVYKSLMEAMEARKELDLYKEIQLGINIHILLGIISEGIINEISANHLESSTLKELEKAPTTVKWHHMLNSSPNNGGKNYTFSNDPLQTIKEIQRKRNQIVHPKANSKFDELINISKDGEMRRNVDPKDNILSSGDTIILANSKTVDNFNVFVSLESTKKLFNSVITILDIYELIERNDYIWIKDLRNDLNKYKVVKK